MKKKTYIGNLTRYNNFNKFIQNNNCIYLRYIGNPFIWLNKRKYENTIFFWLDHMLAIISGYICIIILFLKIFPYFGPDHVSILLDLSMFSSNSNYCKFKFETMWLLHSDFYDLIKDVRSNFIKSS